MALKRVGVWLAGLLAAIAVLAFARPAAGAIPIEQPLTLHEVQSELMGAWVWGHSLATGAAYSECTEPNGFSVYEDNGAGMIGAMRVREDGAACYDYHMGAGEEACFRVYRDGPGYRFVPTDPLADPDIYITARVQRGVKACPLPGRSQRA